MIIDYKEIPEANKGGGHQDHFELFSRDFLEAIGYKIVRHPDRGADGKKDLIISETRKGVDGETTVSWLVSCKHFAHSGSAVKDTDEPDILDRVHAHKCDGFIGVYSTLPASSLSNKLFGYKDKIEHIIYDSALIEKRILNKHNEQLLVRYFPKSHASYQEKISREFIKDEGTLIKALTAFTEEDLLRIQKTAIIIIELEKFKKEFFRSEWKKREDLIDELSVYAEQSNHHVAEHIFEFLLSVANQTRSGMTYNNACGIFSAVLNFFPSLYDEGDRIKGIKIAELAIQIGNDMVYDSFIHLRNIAVAMWGLSIIKFIYREAKSYQLENLMNVALKAYSSLERHLDRPERKDLEDAKQFLKEMKADLDEWSLSFPVLSPNLMKRFESEKEK